MIKFSFGNRSFAYQLISLLGIYVLSIPISLAQLNEINEVNPTAECDEKSQIVPTCLFSRSYSSTAFDLMKEDVKVCACLEKNNGLFANYPATDKLSKEKSDKIRAQKLAAEKAGTLSILQANGALRKKGDQDVALLVYGGQESRSNRTTTLPVTSEKLTKLNAIDEQNKSWQCVTYQQYSVHREIPSENDFFLLLQKSSFKSSDWNASELIDKYDSAAAPEKDAIRLKLSFLSRNPIFETIMKAKKIENFSAADIERKQRELFEILKTLSPAQSSKCFETVNGCFQEIHANGNFEKYATKVGSFIMDPAVIDMASAQASIDYKKELERISSEGGLLVNSVPADPQGYFNYLQTSNTDIARRCSGKTVEATCYTQFSQHCKHINELDKRIKKGLKLSAAEIVNGLREETNVHVSLDPATNPGFRSFNDKICLEPYRNSSGEALNFFQFEQSRCGENSTRSANCSNRSLLVQEFMSEYNIGSDPASANLRSGFRDMVADTRFLDISTAQVIAANSTNESPTQLRARFGGEFPAISPEGRLIPFVPSNINSRTASTGSTPSSTFENNLNESSQAGSTGASSFVPASSSSADLRGNSSSSNSAVRSRESIGSTSNLVPDSIKLPELPSKRNIVPYYPEPRRAPASITESASVAEDEEVTPLNQVIPQVRPSAPVKGSAGRGGGSGPIVSSASGPVASANGGGQSGSNESGTYTRAVNSRRNSNSKGLLFKYGLDEKNQPEISLVSASTAEVVKVGVDKNLMERIKSNPNALEMGQADLDKIMATPDAEVKLVLEASNGTESLVVYAKKDQTGGISFSLKQSRLPASVKKPIRINVLPEVYTNIASNPDVYLNQNETLMNEIVSKPGSPPTLQIVSPGKKALIYEVIKTDEYIYHFKLKNK